MSDTPQLTINDEEIALIKTVFAENEMLLKSLRALFFGLPMSEAELTNIRETFADEKLRAIMHKRFLPRLNKEMPIGQLSDIWLGTETMIFGKTKEEIYQAIQYKKLSIEMTEQALSLLENPKAEVMSIVYDPSASLMDEYQIALLARNQYVRHIESQLLFLHVIAGTKEETAQEAKKRLTKDSSK